MPGAKEGQMGVGREGNMRGPCGDVTISALWWWFCKATHTHTHVLHKAKHTCTHIQVNIELVISE